ncbi:unnamed protein product [Parajaminaea phylloscopi]
MPIVLPGDIAQLPSSSSTAASIRLGPGLLYPSEAAKAAKSLTLLATHAGPIGKVDEKGKGKERSGRQEGWWVESNTQRYLPSSSDPIIGQITAKNAEFYTVSLSSAHSATLNVLAFEGATKRHRPNLKVGALVYGFVSGGAGGAGGATLGQEEPEVSCVDANTGKSNGMGELETKEGCSGTVLVSLGLARGLLRASHPLLPLLASHFPFESAIGANGLIWIRTTLPQHFVAAKLVLEAADDAARSFSGSDQPTEAHSGQPDKQAPQLFRPEKAPGQWGRKLASQWGTVPTSLSETDVRRIVDTVLGR